MQTPTRTTTLRDASGQSHTYVAHMHGAISGITLGNELLALLGETAQLQKGVGACISGLAGGIIARGGVKLVERLLEHTSRDGKKLVGLELEQAYQANYGELLEALVWIIEENFGSFSEAAVRVVGPRLAKMMRPPSTEGSWLASLATGASGRSSAPASPAMSSSATAGASPI